MRVLPDQGPQAPHAAVRRPALWADLGLRTLSAVVLLPLGLACAWYGGVPWLLIIGIGALICAAEWAAMCKVGQESGVLLLAGFAYLALAVASLLWLRADAITGRANLLFLLLAVWAGDVGAYLVGRWVGGPRIAPSISPGKTWSGAAGGLAASALAGLAASLVWPHGATTASVTLAVLIGAAAQLGDLLESLMKRHCGVKDSGRLIPGHGGLLDRLDGVLLAAPLATFLGMWLGRGIVLWN